MGNITEPLINDLDSIDVVSGTLIFTRDGPLPVDSLVINTEIWTNNGWVKIDKICKLKNQRIRKLKISNGIFLKVSETSSLLSVANKNTRNNRRKLVVSLIINCVLRETVLPRNVNIVDKKISREPLTQEEDFIFNYGMYLGNFFKTFPEREERNAFSRINNLLCDKNILIKIFIDGISESQNGELAGPANFINYLGVYLSFLDINNYAIIRHQICEGQLIIDKSHEWTKYSKATQTRLWAQKIVKQKRRVISNVKDGNETVYSLTVSSPFTGIACNNIYLSPSEDDDSSISINNML